MSNRPKMTNKIRSQYEAVIRGDFQDINSYGYAKEYDHTLQIIRFLNQFRNYEGVDFEKLQGIVLSSNNARAYHKFCGHIKEADINKFQEKILKIKDKDSLFYIKRFAYTIKGVDINKLHNHITILEVMWT